MKTYKYVCAVTGLPSNRKGTSRGPGCEHCGDHGCKLPAPKPGCFADSNGVHDIAPDPETGTAYCQGCDLDAEDIPAEDSIRMT